MRANYLRGSWSLLGLSVLLLIALTLFESALLGISLTAQRWIGFLALVLPATVGAALGVVSLTHREGAPWLAILAVILNILFALFHLFVILFAG